MNTKEIKIYNCLDSISQKLRESLRLFDNLVNDGECILDGDILDIGKGMADLFKKTSYAAGSTGFQALPNANAAHQMSNIYETQKAEMNVIVDRLQKRIDANNNHSEAIWSNKMC